MSDKKQNLIIWAAVSALVIIMFTKLVDRCVSGNDIDTNEVIKQTDIVVDNHKRSVDSIKYDIVIINKEKNEAIKISRNLSDSAAVELFKQLVTD